MVSQDAVLASFILRVGHERLLHRLRRLDPVLLLDDGRRRCRNRRLRHHLQRLDDRDVAQLLSDRQGRLPLTGDRVRRGSALQQEIDNHGVALLGSLVHRRVALARDGVNLALVAKQEADHVHLAKMASHVQWGVAALR